MTNDWKPTEQNIGQPEPEYNMGFEMEDSVSV